MASAICTASGVRSSIFICRGPRTAPTTPIFDEEEPADWRTGRDTVYQLAALTIGARIASLNRSARCAGLNQEAEGAFGCEGYLPHWLVLKSPRPRFYGLN